MSNKAQLATTRIEPLPTQRYLWILLLLCLILSPTLGLHLQLFVSRIHLMYLHFCRDEADALCREFWSPACKLPVRIGLTISGGLCDL
ncbi:hypothetical protein DFJ77DRAFT_294175 [Powellomyces hirtus]|nr:hypothetical protein DFJ77DRAFT_294175 [Powellomyces hirtus]